MAFCALYDSRNRMCELPNHNTLSGCPVVLQDKANFVRYVVISRPFHTPGLDFYA